MGRRRIEGQCDVGDGVYRRPNGIWELRYKVPDDVQHAFPGKGGSPQKLKVVSLGVRDPQAAKGKAREERAKLDVQVHFARTERVDDRLNAYLRTTHAEAVASLDMLRAEESVKSRERLFGPKPTGDLGLKEKIRAARLAPVDEAAWIKDRISWGRAAAGNDPDMPLEVAAGMQANAFFVDVLGRTPDTTSPEYRRVLKRCADVIADGLYAVIEQSEGRTAPPPTDPALSASPAPADESVDGNRATDARANLPFSAYHEEVYLPAKAGEIEPGTIKTKRQSIELFKALVGDPPLFLVRRADVTDFQAKLRNMPDGRMVTGELAGKSEAELAALAAAGSIDLPRKGAGTIDKHVRDIKTVLSFAHQNGHVRMNPALGIKNVKPTALNPTTKKRSFTRAELERIWSQPLYAGCAKDSVNGVYRPGKLLIRDDRFWIPMLLFLTGARAMEVAGLSSSGDQLPMPGPT